MTFILIILDDKKILYDITCYALITICSPSIFMSTRKISYHSNEYISCMKIKKKKTSESLKYLGVDHKKNESINTDAWP